MVGAFQRNLAQAGKSVLVDKNLIGKNLAEENLNALQAKIARLRKAGLFIYLAS
jgi:hypothetical protein